MKQQKSLQPSLKVYDRDRLIFSSTGKWLYPIMELEQFLDNHTYDVASLFVEDKIVGRAAALLFVRLGIRKLHARLMSTLAREVLDRYKISYSFDEIQARIACHTEDLLANEWDAERAYHLIQERT